MEVARYFLYKGRIFVYALLAVLLSSVVSTVASSRCELFVLPIWLQLLLARTLDDFFDYEKDERRSGHSVGGGEERELRLGKSRYGIDRRRLGRLCVATALLYTGVNLLIYAGGGLFCLVIVLWMLLEEKFLWLQSGAGAVSGAYYLSRVRPLSEFGLRELVFLGGLVLLSLVFGVWKRKKRDDL
ncbi:MAG: hypothetical protein Q3993_03935 [Filifactor alocis]|nr:hypothetical protein [Filifactor alocis]